ncbi:MAG: hypothetical protein RL117_2032 [Verrucomicrobiota bacterium]|jgi:hypothetical protein
MKKRPYMSEREAYAPVKRPNAPKQPCVEMVKRDKKTLDGEIGVYRNDYIGTDKKCHKVKHCRVILICPDESAISH